MAEFDKDSSINVEALSSLIADSDAQWVAGPNFLTELSQEERARYLGFTPPGNLTFQIMEEAAHLAAAEHAMGAVGAPSSFDWRNVNGQNYVTSVKNQGGCGSCVAFGTVAAVESTYRVQRGDPNLPVDLSEASLFYCIAKSQGRSCANGWWPADALTGFKNIGVPDEACFPYTAADQNCTQCGDSATRSTKITNFHQVTSVADMKTWISTHGPLSVCFTVYSDFFAYKSGVYKHVSGDLAGGHCVCAVGYDDAQGCWICKNSWSAAWGDGGYVRIGYGECGIESQVHAVDGILETGWLNNKTVVGLWTIDQDRNAWAYLSDVGWRRISAENDVIFQNMLIDLVGAKTQSRPVNVYQDAAVIKQVYAF